MTNRLVFSFLLGTIVLATASLGQERECDEQLPQELRQLGKQLGCGPVPRFYDRPGMVDPPYLYGWLPGEKEESAAFWCYREHEEKSYLLVFVEDLGNAREGRVTSTIPWHNYPGGLSLFDIENVQLYDLENVRVADSQHLPLSLFYYVDNPKEQGPRGKTTKFAPLQDSYDGTATLFYRDGARWLYFMLD